MYKSKQRRKNILDRMDELNRLGQNCLGCPGTCCTYTSNSMQVTPLEAMEIIEWIKAQSLNIEELKGKLKENIKQFRLDQFMGARGKSFIRRTYTCPFFKGEELGCMIAQEYKPYGCLAFNNHHESEKAGTACYSDEQILIDRENLFSEFEQVQNQLIKDQFNFTWEKLPIPVALLEILEHKN